MQEIDELEKRLKDKIKELDAERKKLEIMDTLKGQIEAQAIELKNKDTIIDKLIDEKVRDGSDEYY